MDVNRDKKQAAKKALLYIAMMEGFFFLAILVVFFQTKNFTHLIIGILGSMLIFGPMFFRWFKLHGTAFADDKRDDNE